jgi:hypothetical protein
LKNGKGKQQYFVSNYPDFTYTKAGFEAKHAISSLTVTPLANHPPL